MLQSIKLWIIHLFNPHCIDCYDERLCKQCDEWKLLYEYERTRRTKLEDQLITLLNPQITTETNSNEEPVQIGRKFVPWRTLRQQLETRDREQFQKAVDEGKMKANIEVERAKTTEELEFELGIVHPIEEVKGY